MTAPGTTHDPIEHARRLLLDASTCPSCHAPLAGPRCARCGIDLGGAGGAEVWQASRAAADALARRTAVVARLRAQQHPVAPTPGAVPAPAPVSVPAPVPAPVPVSTAPVPARLPPPPLSDVAPPAPPRSRRPWTVQTVLVTLGAGLLALASLVFLAFTWDVLDLAARAVVVALGTAAVLGLAALLRRRELVVSAEAVGALGAALVLLDAWAVHATGLSGPLAGRWFACVAALASGALLAVYGTLARIRAGRLAGALLVPLAPAALLVGAPSAAAAAAAALAGAVLTSPRLVPRVAERLRPAERAVLGVVAAVLTGIAGIALLVGLADGPWSPGLLALLAATVGLLAVQSALGAGRTAAAWAGAAGTLPTLAVALAVPRPAAGVLAWSVAGAAGVVAAVHGVLVVPALAAGRTRGVRTARAAARAATWALLALAAPAVLVVAAAATLAVLPPGRTAPEVAGELVGVLAAIVALAVAGARAQPWARHAAAGLAVLGTLAGVALLTATPAGAAIGWALLAVGCAFVPLPRPWSVYPRVTAALAAAGAVVAGLVADAADGASPLLAAGGLAVALVVTLASRPWGGRAWRTTTGPLAAVLAWAALARAGAAADVAGAARVSAAVVGSALVVLVLARGRRRPGRDDRHALLATAAAGQALAWLGGLAAWSSAGDAAGTAVVAGAACLQAALVAALGERRVARTVRSLAAGLVAPAAAVTLATAHVTLDASPLVPTLVGCGALGAASVLVARAWPALRSPLQVGGAATTGAALLLSWAVAPGDVATLLLVLSAATAALVALEPDRRWARWAALVLAAVASWNGLAVRGVGTPEAYLAPWGVVLAVLGVRRGRRGRAPGPFVAAGILLVGLVPTVVDDPLAPGWPTRTALVTVGLVVLGAAAVLLARSGDAAVRALATGIAVPTAVLAAAGPVRRTVVELLDPHVPVEVWSLSAALVLALVVRTLRSTLAPAHAATVATLGWPVVTIVAVLPTALAVLPGAGVPDTVTAGLVRAGLAAAAATVVAVAGVRERRVLATGLGLLGAVTVTALTLDPGLPPDGVLATAGALACAVGVARLRADPTLASWPALGPGLLVALGPALVGLQVAPAPWRVLLVVGGGLVAVLAGALRRLRAPFLVGAGVLAGWAALQLLALAGSLVDQVGWWPLLFAGGAALVALGVTYERRLRDAREAARYVAALR